MGDLGFNEIVVIVIFAIILYGKELPQAARKLAGLYGKLRRQLSDIKDELQRQIPAEELKLPVSPEDFTPGDPPPAPTNLVATVDRQEVTLTWVPANDTNYYAIKRASSPEESLSEIATSIYGTSYTDFGLTDGQTYRYAVASVNNFGQSPNSEEVTVTIARIEGQAPAAPPAAAEAAAGGNGAPATENAGNGAPAEPSVPPSPAGSAEAP